MWLNPNMGHAHGTSQYFFLFFFVFFLNLHITSYWSKLDGNGEIVWGRTFFSTFNLSYNLLYDTFSGPSVDLSGN